MKVVIFAGGKGTRLTEETMVRPKPMVMIGGQPILWHIMQYYAAFSHTDFYILAGYKQEVIRGYFAILRRGTEKEVRYDIGHNGVRMTFTPPDSPFAARNDWTVTILDTGTETNTAGRLAAMKDYVDPEETFLLTYGDGLSNVDLHKLVEEHKNNHALITMTVVHPTSRFGYAKVSQNNHVTSFIEKPLQTDNWINGGFFAVQGIVLHHPLFNNADNLSWENGPLQAHISLGHVFAHRHEGFWQCMDNAKERDALRSMWESGQAPWVVQK